ncbi:hypothetical protein R50073_01560 [Maricurvus nonylphenolicus]|uniref:hypothetical protein n=1 Tax=Maricurvus nonylphenolicus TaxID=1008307 RepID=UPI0036F3E7A9
MKQVFVLQNQLKQFLTKSGEWSDGRDANSLYRSEHKDEAINQQFEVSSKDYTLRISLLKCTLNDRRNPIIPEEHLPEPMAMPDVEAEEAGTDEAPQTDASEAVEQTEASNQEQVQEQAQAEPETEIQIDASEFESVARDLFGLDAEPDTQPIATEAPEVAPVADLFAAVEASAASEAATPAANDEAVTDTLETAAEPSASIQEQPSQAEVGEEAAPSGESDNRLF